MKCYYNIARALVLSHSAYVSVLKISIVLADSVSKSIHQNFFFFARAAVVSEGKNIIFGDNN